MALRPRHISRYGRIAEVLTRHGFGAVVAQLGLTQYLDLTRRIFRRPREPEDDLTPAKHVRLALEELGPTFVKLGQILSTRPDLLPPEFINELSLLQDSVPPAPWDTIRPYLEAELGYSIEQLFIAFDPTPIASASLAQVYAATLPDGKNVVVKVQRPGIEVTISKDLQIFKDLARLAQERTAMGEYYDLADLAEEFSVALRAELDYRREGRSADQFRANFAREPHIYTPKVYWEYSNRRVLVQERISGIKVNDIVALDAAGYDRHQIALHAAKFIIKEILEDGFFHADPHPGNILVMPGEILGLMDFGTVGYLSQSDRANLVRLFIVAIQMDAESVVEQLVRMGIAGPMVERMGLQRDLQRMLLKYNSVPLNEVSTREVLEEIEPIIYRYHLRLPSDYWLLIKTLGIMEGVGKTLAPDFDIFAFAKPYVARFLRGMWKPSQWAPSVLRNLVSWYDLGISFPRQVNRVLSQAEQGEFGVRVQQPELRQSTNRLDLIANRLILGMLLSALIVALAMLMPSLNLTTWPWSLFTWIIVVSFAVMSVLALWLIVSILRAGRL
jgi:ubiquinone biosynthesis protein